MRTGLHRIPPIADQRWTVTKPALVRMITAQFDLDDDTAHRLETQYDERRLLSLLSLHYTQKDADNLAPSGQSQAYGSDDARNFRALLD